MPKEFLNVLKIKFQVTIPVFKSNKFETRKTKIFRYFCAFI